MNGTELRSFSHFQILTKIAYSELGRNLQIGVKVSQNDQIPM